MRRKPKPAGRWTEDVMSQSQAAVDDQLRGFSAPLSPTGDLSLFGPPPWSFEGYAASVLLAFDTRAADALIPKPLRLAGDAVCRISVHDLVCDFGHGAAFAQANPDLAHVHEAVVAVMVDADGAIGQWCPFLWCDQDAEFAIGREFYGWPQKLARLSLTRPPLRRSWQAGDVVTGLASRGHRSLFEMRVELERAGDIPGECGQPPAFPLQAEANLHFTETVQMHPVDLTIARRLVSTVMEDVVVQNLWSGPVTFRPFADELQFLADATPIGGRWHELAWKKPWADSVIREGTVAL